MKQRVVYSKATGAVVVITFLLILVCCVDSGSWMRSAFDRFTNFGKTHFIVGYSPSESTLSTHGQPNSTSSKASHRNSRKRVLFSPDDDLRTELIALINAERKSIKIAIFTFTDKQVAQAILDAHARGVAVELVADSAYLRDQYSKIALLRSHKIPVFTYNPHYKNLEGNKQELLSIMHHKFVIFGGGGQQPVVWTGSFNFTRSATMRNQENVVILDDEYVIERYSQQFERLKHRCDDCAGDGEKLQQESAVIA